MDRSKSLFVYGLCLVGPALAAGRPDGKDDGALHSRASAPVATPVPMSAVSSQEAFSAIASFIPASAMRSVASVASASPASIQHPEPLSAMTPASASSMVASPVSAVKSAASSAASVAKSEAVSAASAVKSDASLAIAKASSVVASVASPPASAVKSMASSIAAPVSSKASAAKSEASSVVASVSSIASSAIVPAKESASSVIAHSAISSPASAMRSMVPSVAPSSAAPSVIASSKSLSAVSSVIAHSAEAPKTTPAPTTAKSTPYIDDWRTRATWPVGCEEWANPCPQGVPLENGSIARTLSNNYVPVGSQSGYTNGFTSFLTMTDENGVVTGMPPVATLPAGVSKLPDWVTRTSPAPKPAAPSTMTVHNPVPVQLKSSKSLATAAHVTQSAGSGMISTTSGASSVSRTIGISCLIGLAGLVAVML